MIAIVLALKYVETSFQTYNIKLIAISIFEGNRNVNKADLRTNAEWLPDSSEKPGTKLWHVIGREDL
ncbi:hypothetical protein BH11BAC3_BH11BAC3_46150 [soil metagenome]